MLKTEEKQLEYFNYLIANYPVKDRYKNILKQIQDLMEALDLGNYVYINTDLLGQSILDYFEDIDKLKQFEGIKKINVDKIYSYETYWLLRRKPIQIIENNQPKNFRFVNEKIFTYIFIVKLLTEMGVDLSTKSMRLFPFMELIYYNFRFREYTPKTLETVVSGFFCGYSLNK